MITLNNKKFAENEKEFTDSLFEGGGTCVGYARINKKTISILNIQKEKIGVITIHKVLLSATKLDSKKWWYSFATIKEIGEYNSYSQEIKDIDNALLKLKP